LKLHALLTLEGLEGDKELKAMVKEAGTKNDALTRVLKEQVVSPDNDKAISGDNGKLMERLGVAAWLQCMNRYFIDIIGRVLTLRPDLAASSTNEEGKKDNGDTAKDVDDDKDKKQPNKNLKTLGWALYNTDATRNITRALRAEIRGNKKDGTVSGMFEYDDNSYHTHDRKNGSITDKNRTVFILRMIYNLFLYFSKYSNDKSEMDGYIKKLEGSLQSVLSTPQAIENAKKIIEKSPDAVKGLDRAGVVDGISFEKCKNIFETLYGELENKKDEKEKKYTKKDLESLIAELKTQDVWKDYFSSGNGLYDFKGSGNFKPVAFDEKPPAEKKD